MAAKLTRVVKRLLLLGFHDCALAHSLLSDVHVVSSHSEGPSSARARG